MRKKRSHKTPAKTTELIPQAHGGALRRGGTNAGGPGRPPSAIREKLRVSFDERVPILEKIADGEVIHRTRVRIADIVPYLACPNCGEPGLKLADGDALFAEVSAVTSASPKDRITAVKLMGDLGLGPDKELTVEAIKERLKAQLAVLEKVLTPEQLTSVVPKLRAVWNGRKTE
jgi:hypothetical protein